VENDHSTAGPSARPSGTQARQVLRGLDADRAILAERLTAPKWLYPLVALIAAAYVATPIIQPDNLRNAGVGILLAAGVGLLSAYQRLSGVRVGRTGIRGAGLLVGLLVAILLMLSTTYGLVSLLGAWWVLAPAAACFVMVLVGGRWFDRLYRENLRRGH
jgi:hypothetical protein